MDTINHGSTSLTADGVGAIFVFLECMCPDPWQRIMLIMLGADVDATV